MRRGGPPQLPVDPAAVPAFCRVERGARGLRFAPIAAPANASASPGAPLRIQTAAPAGMRQASVVAEGALVLAASPGTAFTLTAPRMHVVHDRRPPGLDRVIGAAAANAGLIHGTDGWRAVVLPSLGDIAADLGQGPVAIRADGRRIAATVGGAIEEYDIGAEGPVARHEGVPDALCYGADGALVVAVGSRVGAPGVAAGDGAQILELVSASAASRIAARHADGSISVWEPGSAQPLASWPAPLDDVGSIALSADGALVALGTPAGDDPVACLVEARDGAQVRRVEGARLLAPTPDRETVLVAGDWGCAWMKPLEEDS
jgi:hypothetical protein